eukprot:scaffold1124_cov37-Tisochrysis_lutea.AAC.1
MVTRSRKGVHVTEERGGARGTVTIRHRYRVTLAGAVDAWQEFRLHSNRSSEQRANAGAGRLGHMEKEERA